MDVGCGVVSGAHRQGASGKMSVHPRGRQRPCWEVSWSMFEGAPRPKVGMLVDVYVEGDRA